MKRVFGLHAILAVLVLAGCSMGDDAALAEAQVPMFHSQLNAAAFENIYAASAPELQKATSAEDFVALLDAVNRKLGLFEKSTQTNWKVNYHTSGTFVTLVHQSNFEQGAAEEKFVYRIEGGKALLSGYHINSNALVIR